MQNKDNIQITENNSIKKYLHSYFKNPSENQIG